MQLFEVFKIDAMDSYQFSLSVSENFFARIETQGLAEFDFVDKMRVNFGLVNTEDIIGSMQVLRTVAQHQSLEIESPSLKTPITGVKRQLNGLGMQLSQKPKASKTPQQLKPSMANYSTQKIAPPQQSARKTQMFAECIIEGENTFMCTVCAYKTKINSNIHRHVRSKHGENLPNYKCTSCEYLTAEKAKLKSHYMKSHNLAETIAKMAADASQIAE